MDNEHRINIDDVKKIYSKTEKSKKGSFFIDNSKNQQNNNIMSNHIDIEIADFYSSNEFNKKILKEDSKSSRNIIDGII